MTTSGADWIWLPTRLAIYARDGWRCIACGGDGTGERRTDKLSLDHVKPESRGGASRARNLITMCVGCNSQRHATPFEEWRPDLVPLVRSQLRKKLDRRAARELAEDLRPERFMAKRVRDRAHHRLVRAGSSPHAVAGVPF